MTQVEYFVAHMLLSKVRSEWHLLPADAQTQLAAALYGKLTQLTSSAAGAGGAPPVVVKRLTMVLAAAAAGGGATTASACLSPGGRGSRRCSHDFRCPDMRLWQSGRVAVQMGSMNEPRDSPNVPQASPPDGFPSAFNPIEPSD